MAVRTSLETPMRRPPINLTGLSDPILTYWLSATEKDLKAEIERIEAMDIRFKRVLADAMRVQDEVDRRI